MTDSEWLRQQILDGYSDLHSAWGRADTAVKAAIDSLPIWMPGWVKDDVKDKWGECHQKGLDFLDHCETVNAQAGRAYPLRTAADAWRDTVEGHLSSLPGYLAVGELNKEHIFEGRTADAYRETVIPQQSAAMAAISDSYAKPIAGILDDCAKSIDDFGWAQVEAIAALFAAMISLIAAVATTEFPPAQVAAIVVMLLALGGAALTFYAAQKDHDSTAESLLGDLKGMLDDWSSFENHAWPKAVLPSQ